MEKRMWEGNEQKEEKGKEKTEKGEIRNQTNARGEVTDYQNSMVNTEIKQ